MENSEKYTRREQIIIDTFKSELSKKNLEIEDLRSKLSDAKKLVKAIKTLADAFFDLLPD